MIVGRRGFGVGEARKFGEELLPLLPPCHAGDDPAMVVIFIYQYKAVALPMS